MAKSLLEIINEADKETKAAFWKLLKMRSRMRSLTMDFLEMPSDPVLAVDLRLALDQDSQYLESWCKVVTPKGEK